MYQFFESISKLSYVCELQHKGESVINVTYPAAEEYLLQIWKNHHCADGCRVFSGETDPGQRFCSHKRVGVSCLMLYELSTCPLCCCYLRYTWNSPFFKDKLQKWLVVVVVVATVWMLPVHLAELLLPCLSCSEYQTRVLSLCLWMFNDLQKFWNWYSK